MKSDEDDDLLDKSMSSGLSKNLEKEEFEYSISQTSEKDIEDGIKYENEEDIYHYDDDEDIADNGEIVEEIINKDQTLYSITNENEIKNERQANEINIVTNSVVMSGREDHKDCGASIYSKYHFKI